MLCRRVFGRRMIAVRQEGGKRGHPSSSWNYYYCLPVLSRWYLPDAPPPRGRAARDRNALEAAHRQTGRRRALPTQP